MEQNSNTTQLEGTVVSRRYNAALDGLQSLGVAIDDGRGNLWVVDYEEQSPYHVFGGRRVVAFGEAYEPDPLTPHMISSPRGWVGHFRVSSMKLADVTPDADVLEIGPRQALCGRLERHATWTGKSVLTFVTEGGEGFLVTNDPAGSRGSAPIEVCAYTVRRSPATSPGPWLWIICPYSMADLWKWRRRT